MQSQKVVQRILWFPPSLRLTVVGRVEATEQADGGNPAVHVLLRLSHKVPGPLLRPQVENKAALQLLLCERQASIHLKEKNIPTEDRIY